MTAEFDAPSVIKTKRDGSALSDAAIDWVVAAYTDGRVADEQMSALLMAILLKGMSRSEIARWTAAMIASGERMDFSDLRRQGRPLVTVDKHSTGGIGDKITIPLVPLVIACGGAVPQASGRGLGLTGGTLDKLEAIPGWSGEMSTQQIRRQLGDVGGAIFAAGPSLAPADRKIYALRDVTGTVESLPLVASSVMSKKIAEGTRSLVLDVKTGSGAVMKTVDEARDLAKIMVELGTAHGVATRALVTDMNRPLGQAVGNAIEVAEALDVLAGGGPADVVELTLALAREMLDLVGLDEHDPADALRDGSAMDAYRDLIAAQGGEPSAPLPLGEHAETVLAETTGTMGDIDANSVGLASWRLGAGRASQGERVQSGAGVRIHRRPGDSVTAGEPIFTMYTDTPERLPGALAAIEGAWTVGEAEARPLIIERILP